MIFINYPNKDEWREWDQDKMLAINYRGGFCEIDENQLEDVEYCICNSWHDLYKKKNFCPLEVESWFKDVWIAPSGKLYDGVAHDVTAEQILSIIYGEEEELCPGDRLEARGWIRATTGIMWNLRLDELVQKRLTNSQYNALFDWCQLHKINFPFKDM